MHVAMYDLEFLSKYFDLETMCSYVYLFKTWKKNFVHFEASVILNQYILIWRLFTHKNTKIMIHWNSAQQIQGPPYILERPIQKWMFPSIISWIWSPNLARLGFRVLSTCHKNFVTLSQKLWIFFLCLTFASHYYAF